MKTNWTKGEIEPLVEGEYYTICEAKINTAFYRKGDVEITTDYYSKDMGWQSIGRDNPIWKVVAWTGVILPDVPEQLRDRVVTYFGVDMRREKR